MHQMRFWAIDFFCGTNLIGNGRKDPVVVVYAQSCVNIWQGVWLGPEQDPESNVDVLQVFGTSDGGDVLRASPDVENDGFLHPGDHEVGTFSHHVILDSLEPVEDDGSMATVHVEQGRLDDTATDGQGNTQLANPVKQLTHACHFI